MRTVVYVLVLLLAIAQGRAGSLSSRISRRELSSELDELHDLKMTRFHVKSRIRSRFATTSILSTVENRGISAREILFKATLPNSAFITSFEMQVNDRLYIGDVKEKADAKITYDTAKARGETAGLASQSIRETNSFEISTNVEAHGVAKFNLTYQEILQRVDGAYKHILNINPGQVVDDMEIRIEVVEKTEITTIKVPKVEPRIGERTNSDLLGSTDTSDVTVQKQISTDLSTVTATYNPSKEKQNEDLGEHVSGQMVLLYDVQRDASAGNIEVVDGYFVQFIAPSGLKAGSKRVVFVLDTSGSMSGDKIKQMKDAMKSILQDMNSEDLFNIITFSSDVTNWKSEMVKADAAHLKEARDFVNNIVADGMTATYEAYKAGLKMLKATKASEISSMLIFLTDGLPTVGSTTDTDSIASSVKSWNSEDKFNIHNVAFGNDADYEFMKKISSQNRGLARKVFVDSDASLQLKGFYEEISTPLLSQVNVTYVGEKVDVNSIVLNRENDFVDGSEILVAGRLRDGLKLDSIESSSGQEASKLTGTVEGLGASGVARYVIDYTIPCWDLCEPCVIPYLWEENYPCWEWNCCWNRYSDGCYRPRPCGCRPRCPVSTIPPPLPITTTTPAPLPEGSFGGFVERMWAYLTIKKLIDDAKYKETDTTKQEQMKKKALQLSLKYHFVTELTSLVVTTDSEERALSKTEIDTAEKEESKGIPAGAPANFGGFGGSSALNSGARDRGQSAFGTGGATKGDEDSQEEQNQPRPTFEPLTTSKRPPTTESPNSEETTEIETTTILLEPVNETAQECTFHTIGAEEVDYDRFSKIAEDTSLSSRDACAALCFANSATCEFAIWLPNGRECLLYDQTGLLDCNKPEKPVLKFGAVILYCINCSSSGSSIEERPKKV